MAKLFRDHPDLLKEFNDFLPDQSQQVVRRPLPPKRPVINSRTIDPRQRSSQRVFEHFKSHRHSNQES